MAGQQDVLIVFGFEIAWWRMRPWLRAYADHMQASLAAPLTGEELTQALRALSRGSFPEDGPSVSFFIRYWELLESSM